MLKPCSGPPFHEDSDLIVRVVPGNPSQQGELEVIMGFPNQSLLIYLVRLSLGTSWFLGIIVLHGILKDWGLPVHLALEADI